MLVLDGAIILGSVGIVLLAALAIRALRRKAKPEIQGAENAEETKAQINRRCHSCKKYTTSDSDLFVDGHWYHKLCYVTEIDKTEKKN
jgi:hypothetical protein